MNNQHYDVVIVGGGPAGSSAGIVLAEMGYSVALIEKMYTVENKICGEFFSPGSLSFLDAMGVRQKFFSNQPADINKVIVSINGKPVRRKFDTSAYGLSRIRFDAMLLGEAEQKGVSVMRGFEVTDMRAAYKSVEIRALNRRTGEEHTIKPVYVIAATGAKSGSESLFVDNSIGSGRRSSVAFKFHADTPGIRKAVELFFTPFGYVGIGAVENERVNVCGLLHADIIKKHNGSFERVLSSLSANSPLLGERLNTMSNRSAYLTCSNLNFGIRRPKYDEVFCIGDTAGSIHPYCGNGITMALKSGILCAEDIDANFKHNGNRVQAGKHFNKMWKREFRKQIAVSHIVYRFIAGGVTRSIAERFTGWFPRVIDSVFKHTRELHNEKSSRYRDRMRNTVRGRGQKVQ